MAEEKHKCAHPACTCQVAKDVKFCSEYCQKAGNITELHCNCLHPECR